ncbi:ATP-dependent nuclease, subunit B [Sporolactobacillus inulinus]|uniref:ATP-dependent nuclease, subunit B n=1 Tax=Sporolactobacillus inulinus TaxID=2078 RepID=A0A4Y1ZA91_9BACL|nr:hypothetical protein [Sporolactobacillus inulinus]GAY75934.1 ATP-dependent nuclease, subunit B [Sporolactobacillus inulinus]
MKHHPLIEFIRSSLEALLQNWRYEPIFRCVKTDFLIPFEYDLQTAREGMDRLENYVIAHGYYGKSGPITGNGRTERTTAWRNRNEASPIKSWKPKRRLMNIAR